MSDGDAAGIVRLLEDVGVRVWVTGGWGVDAQVGRQTRAHRDLDIFVEESQVEGLREALRPRGFEELPGGRDVNFVLWDGKNLELDVHVFALDDEGNGLYQEEAGTVWIAPADHICASGTLLGQQVRCFSPELELQCHSGYELDDDDFHDVAQLRAQFPTAVPLPVQRLSGDLSALST
jgi:lincosamide nucleotidyltransferase A/C/D/E